MIKNELREDGGTLLNSRDDLLFIIIIIIKKVKQSRNSSGVAQRSPGGLGSQISMTFGT